MKKKIAMLLVMVLLLAPLSACGPKEEPAAEAPDPAVEESAPAAKESQNAGTKDPARYTMVTAMDPDLVENIAGAVRSAYLEERWEDLASLIRYPILILDTQLNSAEEFLAFMDGKIVHQSDREAMEQTSTRDLFVNGEGICLGSGQVWLQDPNYMTEEEPRLEIIALSGIICQTPTAAVLQESFFRQIAACQPGTAGASLKRAAAACRVLSFSISGQLRGADVSELRENLLEAWDGLQEEERTAFDQSFPDICRLLDACFEEWESNRPVFEDAGVVDEMEYLLAYPGAREDWSVLMNHTLTLGNSDGE